MTRKFLSVASFRTASRCWVPAYSKQATYRAFSSRQRCVNFNTIEHENNVISNDDILSAEEPKIHSEAPFEPVVFSSEEVFTAGPVNKA